LLGFFSRKYGTVWYHPASSKPWYLTALSFVNFQEKLTGTSFALCACEASFPACCVIGAECTFCVNNLASPLAMTMPVRHLPIAGARIATTFWSVTTPQ
jgi:hypothetical protein